MRLGRKIELSVLAIILSLCFFSAKLMARDVRVSVEPTGLPLQNAVFSFFYEGEVTALQISDPAGNHYTCDSISESPGTVSMPMAPPGIYWLTITGDFSSFSVTVSGDETDLPTTGKTGETQIISRIEDEATPVETFPATVETVQERDSRSHTFLKKVSRETIAPVGRSLQETKETADLSPAISSYTSIPAAPSEDNTDTVPSTPSTPVLRDPRLSSPVPASSATPVPDGTSADNKKSAPDLFYTAMNELPGFGISERVSHKTAVWLSFLFAGSLFLGFILADRQ